MLDSQGVPIYDDPDEYDDGGYQEDFTDGYNDEADPEDDEGNEYSPDDD